MSMKALYMCSHLSGVNERADRARDHYRVRIAYSMHMHADSYIQTDRKTDRHAH